MSCVLLYKVRLFSIFTYLELGENSLPYILYISYLNEAIVPSNFSYFKITFKFDTHTIVQGVDRAGSVMLGMVALK